MLNEVQSKLLNMLKWFHEYCEKNNYRYYIVGGTMIGAMRHGGFIPWDDDIDVVMPRQDYDRFINSFNGENSIYCVESPYCGKPDFYYSYSKLYDTSTTLIEKSRFKCKRGIYIDIFPLDGVGITEEQANRNYRKIDRLNMLMAAMSCSVSKKRSLPKNIAIVIARLIPRKIVDVHKLAVKMDKLSASFGIEKSTYVANLMGNYREKEIVEKRIFGEPTLYKYETIKVYGVQYPEEYLTHVYGDWRKLPNEKKRYTNHDEILLDLNKSYLE